ncbi:MAG: GNAT family N-acetyltransferase [Rhodanobacteraceae bacterium]
MIEDVAYFLRTERLGFRLWRPEDLDLAMGLWGDPLVTQLIDSRGELSAGAVAERLRNEIATCAEAGVQYWPIFLRATHEHVGCCGLLPHDLAARVYELGVHIRSRHWGVGYAHESSRAVVDYAFGTLGAKGLFAGHNPKNEVSRRLLAKLGFRHTHDEFYAPTGLMHPSYTLVPRAIAARTPVDG